VAGFGVGCAESGDVNANARLATDTRYTDFNFIFPPKV